MPASERLPALSPHDDRGLDLPEALELLGHGELDVAGRIIEASNATILAHVSLHGRRAECVYKPVAGERPLRDFPEGTLAAREVAAYELSHLTGFDVVPPTVMRDGPFGRGSVQLWVHDVPPGEGRSPADRSDGAHASATRAHGAHVIGSGVVDVVAPDEVAEGWLPVLQAYGMDGEPVVLVHADDPALRRLALFDVVANNADRKAGHVLHGELPGLPGHRLVGVDHGLTFHSEPKLRTVLWGWAGDQLPDDDLDLVRRTHELLAAGGTAARRLAALLAPDELDAVRDRVELLAARRRFPEPDDDRPVIPWPPV